MVFVTFEPDGDEPAATPPMRFGPYRYVRFGNEFLTVALGDDAGQDWIRLAVRDETNRWTLCGLEGGTRYECILVTPDVEEMREDLAAAEAGDED